MVLRFVLNFFFIHGSFGRAFLFLRKIDRAAENRKNDDKFFIAILPKKLRK